jgi:hypothetical protein
MLLQPPPLPLFHSTHLPAVATVLQAKGAMDLFPVICLKWLEVASTLVIIFTVAHFPSVSFWFLVRFVRFINLYIDVVPEECVLRILDSLFYEGEKV